HGCGAAVAVVVARVRNRWGSTRGDDPLRAGATLPRTKPRNDALLHLGVGAPLSRLRSTAAGPDRQLRAGYCRATVEQLSLSEPAAGWTGQSRANRARRNRRAPTPSDRVRLARSEFRARVLERAPLLLQAAGRLRAALRPAQRALVDRVEQVERPLAEAEAQLVAGLGAEAAVRLDDEPRLAVSRDTDERLATE